MKKFLTRAKEGEKGLSLRACRHGVCIYIAIAVSLLVIGFFVSTEVGHTAEVLKIQKEKAALMHQIQNINELSQEKNLFINLQGEMMRKQSEGLSEAEDIVRQQNFMLEKLIQYLKGIKHWPPKIKPVDPDKWT